MGLPLPVWRGADAEAAHARVDVRRLDARRAAAMAALDASLTERRHAVDRSAAAVAMLEDGLDVLRAHAERVQAAYAAGQVDLASALTVRRTLLEAEERALDARGEYHRALARLTALVGPPEEPER